MNPFQEIEKLEQEVARLKFIISSAVVNLSLTRCPFCTHLGMRGWTCPNCGKDSSEYIDL